jgi:hypothetical protein
MMWSLAIGKPFKALKGIIVESPSSGVGCVVRRMALEKHITI